MKKISAYAVVSMLLGTMTVSCDNCTATLDSSNPFAAEWTENNGMPPFDEIEVVHILPALRVGIQQHDSEISELTSQSESPNFDNTILAYHKSGKLLDKVSTVYGALSASELSDDLQDIQLEVVKLFANHGSDISLNAKLFNRVKLVYDSRNAQNYNPEQIRLIEKTYDSFANSGANLSDEDKGKMRKITSELSELSMKFGNAVMNENNNFRMVIDNESDLVGLSEGAIASAALLAKEDGKDGKWAFSLKKPSYIPFMQSSKNRDLRKTLFEGYSNVGNNDNTDNTKDIVSKTVRLRLEMANLLGYKTFAEYNLRNSVAKTPEAVFGFIDEMWAPVTKRAKAEIKDMEAIMRADGVKGKLEAWDWFYYAEKVRAEKFDLNMADTKPYFEVTAVRDGAQILANKLFGITFKEVKDAVRINPETQVFNIYDKDGSFLSVLTWDFFPRSSKQGGAWCSGLKSQEYVDGKRIAPIVTITCNFTPAIGDTPALITAEEVTTLFHEFGHALQAMFTDIKYPGLTGNPRDFVEFPSQALEYWAFEPDVLAFYAKHYKTGELIPASLVKKMQNSSTFNQGFANSENLSASYLDMVFHSIDNVSDIEGVDVVDFEKKSMADLSVLAEIIPRYRTTYFNHIFGGGYAAGYYSYKWSEVLSADGFMAFSETGDIFNTEVAQRLRDVVLSKGSAVDESVMYKEWRGADPDSKHLMKSLGLQ